MVRGEGGTAGGKAEEGCGKGEKGGEEVRLAALAVVAVLAGCGAQEKTAPRSDWTQIKDCAAQAAHEFEDFGYKRSTNLTNSKTSADFTNHFDAARMRCFVLFEATTFTAQSIVTSKFLADAYERKIYGNFGSSLITVGAKPGEVRSIWDCYVLSFDGQKQVCKTVEEFDALVGAYMAEKAGDKKAEKAGEKK